MIWENKINFINSILSGEINFRKSRKKAYSGGMYTEGIKFPSNTLKDKVPLLYKLRNNNNHSCSISVSPK